MRTFLLAAVLAATVSIVPAQGNAADRTFLFIGTPNGTAWEMLIASPADREASVRGGIEKLGGELLSYHWGLGDGKNYITVSLPDDPTFIQAFYLSRMDNWRHEESRSRVGVLYLGGRFRRID